MKILLSFGLLVLVQLRDTATDTSAEFTERHTDSCTSRCHPLVSGVYGVPDTALTASSIFPPTHLYGTHRARLHTTGTPDVKSVGAWAAGKNRKGEWIQVRFKTMQKVNKVQTQGRHINNQWVTQYKVSTSKDCKTFTDYKEHGKIKVFSGNFDQNTVATHNLNPVEALCFRIIVLAWHEHISLRFEVLGHRECPDGYTYWHGSCYNRIQEKLSWTDAQWYCSWRGGHLVTVDSQAENDWIKTYLLKRAVSNIWINMNRLATGRNWETDPEKPATFLNWAHSQFWDDTTQNCAYMSPAHGHRWLSGECHDRFYFICEG